jgi:hypothetical protein
MATSKSDLPRLIQKPKGKKIYSNLDKSKLIIDEITTALNLYSLKPVTEYKFSQKRRFRADIALVKEKILIEYEGGLYSLNRKSGHLSVSGYQKDCEKYNLAAIENWRVLRYTAKDRKTKGFPFNIIFDVQEILGVN